MKIITKYNVFDLHRGKCKSCGEKTLILNEGILEDKYIDMCPDCIESIKFENLTMELNNYKK